MVTLCRAYPSEAAAARSIEGLGTVESPPRSAQLIPAARLDYGRLAA
jgi:hypothetical protein